MLRVLVPTSLCCVLALAGCQSSLKSFARATTGNLDAPNVAERPQSTTPPPAPEGPLEEPTRDQAFAAVLGDLQEIGRQDPAAQHQLLTQLADADPAHWQGLVHRMQSTLQYQQQLAGEPPRADVMQASSQQAADASPPAAAEPPARPAAPPLPQQPSTWPATPQFSPQPQPQPQPQSPAPAAGAVEPTRRFDPALTQTSASAAAPSTPMPQGQTTMNPYVEPAAAAAPAEAAEPLTWSESLQAAIDALQAELKQRPHSVDEAYQHVRLRLLQLAAGDLDAAAGPPPGLTSTEQEYWSHQLLTISTLLDRQAQPETRRRASAGGLHLENAVAALESLGSLRVANLTFCDEVYGYGAYQPVKQARFRAGDDVKVYAEVANFKTLTTDQGEHTSLATSYRVLDQHGGRVEGGDVDVVNDYCASRRRDFHIQYGIRLPQAIYPGKYVLELTLTDQLGDKIGHGSIEFEIVAAQ